MTKSKSTDIPVFDGHVPLTRTRGRTRSFDESLTLQSKAAGALTLRHDDRDRVTLSDDEQLSRHKKRKKYKFPTFKRTKTGKAMKQKKTKNGPTRTDRSFTEQITLKSVLDADSDDDGMEMLHRDPSVSPSISPPLPRDRMTSSQSVAVQSLTPKMDSMSTLLDNSNGFESSTINMSPDKMQRVHRRQKSKSNAVTPVIREKKGFLSPKKGGNITSPLLEHNATEPVPKRWQRGKAEKNDDDGHSLKDKKAVRFVDGTDLFPKYLVINLMVPHCTKMKGPASDSSRSAVFQNVESGAMFRWNLFFESKCKQRFGVQML